MAPTVTMFALGSQLLYFLNDLENNVLEMFWKHNLKAIHFLLFDFYFQNGENIQDGVFQILCVFL
jgi:hypothetical protein